MNEYADCRAADAMGIEALTTNLQGQQVIPVTAEEWDDWVSASATSLRTRCWIG
jgi:hypothetical protein